MRARSPRRMLRACSRAAWARASSTSAATTWSLTACISRATWTSAPCARSTTAPSRSPARRSLSPSCAATTASTERTARNIKRVTTFCGRSSGLTARSSPTGTRCAIGPPRQGRGWILRCPSTSTTIRGLSQITRRARSRKPRSTPARRVSSNWGNVWWKCVPDVLRGARKRSAPRRQRTLLRRALSCSKTRASCPFKRGQKRRCAGTTQSRTTQGRSRAAARRRSSGRTPYLIFPHSSRRAVWKTPTSRAARSTPSGRCAWICAAPA